MALSSTLRTELWQAIQDYDFPFVTFDFMEKREIRHVSMRQVEACIWHQLHGGTSELVKDGLSNVLYWGYARTGFRWKRITDFRSKVTEQQLSDTTRLLRQFNGTGVRQLAKLGLLQFSGLSFLSKVRMFLDPANYVILDIQLLKLREQQPRTILHEVVWREGTSIRVTKKNEAVYEQWSALCRRAATDEFHDKGIRAVDIERGVFHLIQTGRAKLAADIVVSI